MSDKPEGSFSISLHIWQDAWDQSLLTEKLGLQPYFVAARDQVIGPVVRKRGVWMATLTSGLGQPEFSAALETLWTLLTERSAVFDELASIQADAELLLELTNDADNEPAQFWLNTDMLRALGEAGISLRVKTWNSVSE